jgi:translation initiation factor 3 subunit F
VYVRDVLDGKVQGDEVVGRYLLDTIARIPVGASSTSGAAAAAGAEGKDVGEVWNSCLQDVLMVSYLSNIVRAQAEVAGRLSLLS